MRHLKPMFVPQLRDQPLTIVVDPHGKPPRGALLSIVKIVLWLLEEWYSQLFQEKKEELLICDRYYHDLLIDPLRYRFGAPLWMAVLIGKLMPKPQLWILLNAPADVLQARKQEVTPQETARQCDAYLAYVRKLRNHAIVDASQSLDKVIANVEGAIKKAVMEYDGNRG